MRTSRSYNKDPIKIHNYRIVPCFCIKDPNKTREMQSSPSQPHEHRELDLRPSSPAPARYHLDLGRIEAPHIESYIRPSLLTDMWGRTISGIESFNVQGEAKQNHPPSLLYT